MASKRVIIIGATAPDTLKVIFAINTARTDEIIVEGFLDDDVAKHSKEFMGYPVLGPISCLEDQYRSSWIVNNVARDMVTRQRVVQRLTSMNIHRHLSLIHPSVDTSYSEVGVGCIIQERVVLGARCVIGDHCVLYANAVVGHESVLGDFVFIANNAIVGARNHVGTGAFIGLNSVVLPYVDIGSFGTVGAGSVVLKAVDSESTVFGNPARAGVRPAPDRIDKP